MCLFVISLDGQGDEFFSFEVLVQQLLLVADAWNGELPQVRADHLLRVLDDVIAHHFEELEVLGKLLLAKTDNELLTDEVTAQLLLDDGRVHVLDSLDDVVDVTLVVAAQVGPLDPRCTFVSHLHRGQEPKSIDHLAGQCLDLDCSTAFLNAEPALL